MIRFECDYTEGACPEILARLSDTNMEQTKGYGEDPYCESAREKIRKLIGREDAYVQFLVGGTQTNLTVISSILRPYQGVISEAGGHINAHETGAVEATGHKVLAVDTTAGKLSAELVRNIVKEHRSDSNLEHIVQPGMVYLSYPTENGLIYSRQELQNLYQVCRECRIPLFIDGARLGYGLMSYDTDITLEEIAANCDVFYIGGTKIGALFGEAVVFTDPSLAVDFRYMIKQRGGMLAKGRLLGLQFDTLFTDDLYFRISRHAIDMAMRIRDAFREMDYPFLFESSTNQQFPILPDSHLERLNRKYTSSLWKKVDESHTAVRFCTSWATKEENVTALIADIRGDR